MAVLESMDEIFFSFDTLRNQILRMSPACERVFGYPVDSFIDDPRLWYQQIASEDKERVKNAFRRLKDGQKFREEYRIVRMDGSVGWLDTRIIPTLTKDVLVRIDGIAADITARKEAEENLKTTQMHLVASQHIARVGSWELVLTAPDDFSRCPLLWSDETYRIFGYQPGEVPVTNELFTSHVHPADRTAVTEAVKKTVDEGGLYHVEHRILKKDGQECVVSERGELLVGEGTSKKIIGTVQDITEAKNAEAALRQAEANLRNIFENTDTAYMLLDAEVRIVAFNNRAMELAALVGLMPQIGASYYDLVPESRRREVAQGIKKVLTERNNVSYEIAVPGVAGSDFWLAVSMYPIVNERGRVLGLSIAVRDITAVKAAEQQLKKSNERHELVLKATNDVIWDWELEADTIYRSENFEAVLGNRTSKNATSGMYWIEDIYEEDRERVVFGLAEKLKDPQADLWEEEYRYHPAGGDPVYVRDKGLIIRNEAREAIRMVGAMQDITSEKLLQMERTKITNDLVMRNKDLEQFAYIVSHNLRGPVANILGLAELLKLPAIDAATTGQCMKSLLLSTNLLNNIITDLNHILQVRNEVNEQREWINLARLLQDVQTSIGTLLEKEKAVIKADFSGAEEVFSLKSYLHSIFYNLVLNSVKYKKADEHPLIEVTAKKAKNKVKLVFKDNGTGIDLEKHSGRIFGLYKRFHLHVEGKGLGLFMVRTQVESLGGKIEVRSKPNHGTEFAIELPQYS